MSEVIVNVDPEDFAVVNITVDENSAQSAMDAAAAAQVILGNVINIASGGRHPRNLFKFVQKGFGNNDLQNDELGDVFCGWSDDGTLRYPEAKWIGGPLNTSASFNPLITIIIES